jgi:hypothetical protein|tara:strand:+ start:1471 stop:2688 length:1218 start_codon:yes stop_codon:yes gene_type:complete
MNILQIEDDIKSLPDQNLMEAMQTGSFPQYLVLSELKRRKEMRDDYKGKMAAQSDQGTVADKIMSEASMGINNQGIGSITPPNMQSMQGMPQNTPQLPPQDQGIGQIMPSNMKGMAAGGVVKMFPGQTVPYSMYNPEGVGQFYDFYKERMQPTQAELDYQELMRAYFDPEEAKKRNKTNQGLNLVRAGLAVSGSATPEQLSKNLDPVIASAQTNLDARNKEGLMRAKFEADIGKQDRERETGIAELAYKSEQAERLGGYYDRMGAKDEPIIAIAKRLAESDPELYGIQVGTKEDGSAIYEGPNVAAITEAGNIKGAGAIGSAGIRTQGSQEEQAAELSDQYVASLAGVQAVKNLIRTQGLTADEAKSKVKADYIAELKQLNLLAGGGKVPALPQNPPMLDLSSRF